VAKLKADGITIAGGFDPDTGDEIETQNAGSEGLT